MIGLFENPMHLIYILLKNSFSANYVTFFVTSKQNFTQLHRMAHINNHFEKFMQINWQINLVYLIQCTALICISGIILEKLTFDLIQQYFHKIKLNLLNFCRIFFVSLENVLLRSFSFFELFHIAAIIKNNIQVWE